MANSLAIILYALYSSIVVVVVVVTGVVILTHNPEIRKDQYKDCVILLNNGNFHQNYNEAINRDTAHYLRACICFHTRV